MKGKFTYRFLYEKNEAARYISHLDFVRLMGRALRRAALPVTYSEGYNPHPVMTVAMPISVGVTSQCEYIDIGLDESLKPSEVMERLNRVLPDGIVMLAAKQLSEEDLKFKAVDSAVYLVKVELKRELQVELSSFLSHDTIVVSKKSKSAVKDVDIKRDIRAVSIVHQEGRFIDFEVEVSAGGNYNLKPELVIAAMEKYIPGFEAEFVQVHRLQLLAKGDMLMEMK